MRPSSWILAALALLGLARAATAAEDLVTPRAMAMGQSLRADATANLGPLLNPAGMTNDRAYAIEAMYGFDVRTLGSNVHLSIVDSLTSRVAAGVYYTYINTTPRITLLPGGPVKAKRVGSETGLSLAMPFGDHFALGVTTKYARFTTDAPNPAYDASVANTTVPKRIVLDSSTGSAVADGFTFDVGLEVNVGRFSLAAIGYNLIPLHSIEAPMSLGMGIAFRPIPSLTLALDGTVDFDKYKSLATDTSLAKRKTTGTLGGGLEWLAAGKVAIRAGGRWDSGRPGAWLSMGLGYVGQSFGIDVAYQQQVDAGIDSLVMLSLRALLH